MPTEGRTSLAWTVLHWFVIMPASVNAAAANTLQIRSWASRLDSARMLPPAGITRICWRPAIGGTPTWTTSVAIRSSE